MPPKLSLKQQAYNHIKQKIINCEYAPGLFLTEDILREEINTSRTPIREALGKLEQENLVQIFPKKGIMISKVSIQDINMIYEVRELVESFAIRNYAYNIDRDALLTMRKQFIEQSDSLDNQQMFEVDDQFHQLIYHASNNHYLFQIMAHIYDQNWRLRILTGVNVENRLQQSKHEHLQIIDCLLNQEHEQAVRALGSHFDRAKTAAFSILLSNSNPSINKIDM